MASDKSGLQRLEQFVSKPAAQILGTSARDLANGLKRNQAGRVVFNTAGGPVDVVKALEEALAVVSQLGVGENEELCMVSFRSVAALSVKFAKELSNSELMCQAVRKFVLSRAEWLMSKSSAPFLSGKITKPVVPSDLLAMTFTYAVPSMQNALYYEHHSASSCVRQWTTKLVYQDEFVGVVVPAILLLLGSEPAFEQMQPGRRLDARKRLQRVMLSFLNSVVNRVVLTSEQYVKALSSLVAEPYLRMQLLVLIAQDVTTASADHARAAAMFTRVLWNRAEFRQLLHGRSNEQRRTMMLQRMNETLLTIAHRTDVRTTPFESECLELLADMLGDDHVYRSFWAAHETSICTSIGEISNKHSTFFALGVQPKTERRKLVVTLVRLYVALNRHGQLVSALLHFIRTFQRREVLCRHFKLLWALFSANMPAQRTELGDTLAAAYKKMRLEITAKAVKLKPTGAGVLVDLTPEAEEAAWAKARVAYARAEERAREKQKLHDQREQRRQRKQDRKAVLNSRGSRSQSGVRLAQGSAVSLPPQVGLSRSIRSLTDTFENLEQNRYVGRVRPSQLDIDISVCTCAARRRLVESQAQAQGPVLAPKEHEPVCDVLRCRNARARIECVRGVCMGDCGNQRLQRDQRASTVPAYSKKHKFGLRTNGRLRPGDFVIEYVGEVMSIDSFASDPQRIRAAQLCCRVVLLDGVDVIDASRAGNLARFVNHSCNPNCELQRWSVGAETRLAVVARRSIRAGTEITVDYGRDFVGGVRHACQCNSRLCRRVVEYMLDETVAMHPMLRPPLPNWVSELRPEHSGESPDSSPAKGSLAQVDALLTTISNLSPTPFRRVARARTRKRKQGEPDDAANNQAGDSQQAHSKRQRVAPGYHAAAAMAAGAAAMAYAPYPSFTAYASAANPYIMYAHAMQPVVGMQPLPAPPPPIAPNAPNAQAANAGSNAGANAGVNADPSLPETNQFIVMFNRREGFKSRSTTHIAIARGIMQHRAFMESQGHMIHRPAAPAAARPAVAPVSQQQMAMQVAQQQAQYQQRLVQQASNQQAHALAHAMVHGQPRHFQRQGPAHASLSRPVRAQRAESNNGHAKVYMAQSVEADHVPLSQRQKRG